MVIEFETSIDDVINFNLYHFQHSQTGRRSLFKTRFIIPIVLTVLFIISSFIYRSLHQYPLLVFALVWFIFMPSSYKRGIKKYVRRMYSEGKNKSVICKHKLSVVPEGIVETTNVGEANIHWGAIEKVEATDKYIFIYTSAVAAIIVPKKAFSDDSKYTEFIETVKRYHKETIV